MRRSRSTFCGILAPCPGARRPPLPPPGFSDPSRDPAGATRPVRQILPFALHHGSQAARRGAPCHPRIDGPTRDRFAVPLAPVAATTGRGCVRRRTIWRQSIVIQFHAQQILSSGTHHLAARVDLVKSAFSTLELPRGSYKLIFSRRYTL